MTLSMTRWTLCWIALMLVSLPIPVVRGQTTTVAPPDEITPSTTVASTTAQVPTVPTETEPPTTAATPTEAPVGADQTPTAADAETEPPTVPQAPTAAAETEPPTVPQTPTAAAETEPPATVTPPAAAQTEPPTTATPTVAATVAETPTVATADTELPTVVQMPTTAGGAANTEQPTVVQTPTATTESEPPSVAQTSAPGSETVSPTTSTPVAGNSSEPLPCFTSLTTLDDMERVVTDLDVVRTYVLCANTTFYTGFLTTNGDILGGDKPLTLRKNMHIYCGEVGGSSDNNCVVSRGSFGLTSIPNNFEPATFNENVIVQGVTFENAALYGVLIGLGGTFQFIDCIFTSHKSSVVPILIEWEGGSIGRRQMARREHESPQGRYGYSPLEKVPERDMAREQVDRNMQVSTILGVEFTDCVFKDSTCAPDSRLGLVNLSGDGIDVKFSGCLFQNNNFNVAGVNDAFNYGVIVENFGNGAVSFNSTCFMDNRALGNGLVASYATELPLVSNDFGENNEVDFRTALTCDFVALVDGSNDTFPNVACADFEAATCAFDFELPASDTTQPTMPVEPADTTAPSIEVTMPSKAPAEQESGMPARPTESRPTEMPVELPTSSTSAVQLVSAGIAGSLLALTLLA